MADYTEAEVNKMLGMSASEVEQCCYDIDHGSELKLGEVHDGPYTPSQSDSEKKPPLAGR